MSFFYLACFIAGLLLAVRLMFFGAERLRRAPGALPLRRSEPAIVAFLLAFGIAGYLLARQGRLTVGNTALIAAGAAIAFAVVTTRIAIAAARMQPEHDPEDPRYVLQGRVAVVTSEIPRDGEGLIRFEDAGAMQTVRARDIGNGTIAAGQEVCIERLEDGVAFVELWALVEARL
jgi:hypothetical protein